MNTLFTPDQLDKIVRETLPSTLPDDRTNAIVGAVNADGVSVVGKFVLKDNWELEAAYKRDWLGNQDLGAKVIYSW